MDIRQSEGIHHYTIAATALFLATKTEENCRKTKDIVISVCKVALKDPNIVVDEQLKDFWKWKDLILMYEETMLETLTFDVVLESPYLHLHRMLRSVKPEEKMKMRDISWAFVNDSQLTTIGLRITAKEIAVSALFFAARYTKSRIDDLEEGVPWWKAFGGRSKSIFKGVGALFELYQDNPQMWKSSVNPYNEKAPTCETDLYITRGKSVTPPPPPQEVHYYGATANLILQDKGHGHVKEESGSSRDSGAMNRISEAGDGPADGRPVDIPRSVRAPAAGDDDAALKRAANDPVTHALQPRDYAILSSNATNGLGISGVDGAAESHLVSQLGTQSSQPLRPAQPNQDVPNGNDSLKRGRDNDDEAENGEIREGEMETPNKRLKTKEGGSESEGEIKE